MAYPVQAQMPMMAGGGLGGCYGGMQMHPGMQMHHGGAIIIGGHGCCGGRIIGPSHQHRKIENGKKKDEDENGKKKKKKDEDEDKVDVSAQAPAQLVVSLPAEARLTIDGEATTSTSGERTFVTPALPTGKTFRYTLEAQVKGKEGKAVTWSQKVSVRAGETTRVTLTPPTGVASR
jgi:uncharacterized protein (TIGR03000 family)